MSRRCLLAHGIFDQDPASISRLITSLARGTGSGSTLANATDAGLSAVAEDSIITDHFCCARCTYFVVTKISQGAQITVIARGCIGGNLTTQNRVTGFIRAGVVIFANIGRPDAIAVHAKVLIGANVIVTARTINGHRATAHIFNAAVDGALIIVLTIDGDTSQTIPVNTASIRRTHIPVITGEQCRLEGASLGLDTFINCAGIVVIADIGIPPNTTSVIADVADCADGAIFAWGPRHGSIDAP